MPSAETTSSDGRFATKDEVRQWVWNELQRRQLARQPLPPHGRIPNFEGAEAAAARVFAHAPWARARAIKVNPDSPQLPVRLEALRRGILVYVPTPRLAGGFNLLDPRRIPPARFAEAAALPTMSRWAQAVALNQLPQLDAIVTGCVAVTLTGKRCGKGAGYSDIEFGILRELGHPVVPVATSVHDVQVVNDFPIASNDQPLHLISTPTQAVHVAAPLPAPAGVQWERLSETDLDAMSLLRDLQQLLREAR